MSRIRVHTLGELRIERDGSPVRDLPGQPVRCALLLYLAVERSATRDQLTSLLWPERAAERGRHSLSQTLYELRRQLGDGLVETHGERVEVTAAVEADAGDFVAAVEEGRDAAALELYAGPFLEASHPGGTAEFEGWVHRQRAHLSRMHRELCRRVVSARVGGGDLAGALDVARAWARSDPLEDEAHHQVVELLWATGRRTEALRHYEGYAALISAELGVEPLDETRELARRIRDGESPHDKGPPVTDAPRAGDAPRVPDAPRGGSEAGAEDLQRRPRRPRRRAVFFATASLAMAGLVVLGALWLQGARGVERWSWAGGPEAGWANGIAVLPFLNLSPDPEQEYFADGVTEDLLTYISRIEGLRVISRTSVMRYKGSEAPLREIARELGVAYILEGSVRRDGNQVRVSAQLIEAATDDHLWAQNYDREITGIFALQSEIAQEIADALRRRLPSDERARLAAGGTASMAAYDLVLRGREYLNRPGDADLRKFPPAVAFFRRALDADPAYAHALVSLSEAFQRNVGLLTQVRADSALAYAHLAVEADSLLAAAHAARGAGHLLAGALEEAEGALRRALELDPNQADALSGMATLAALGGRLDRAAAWQIQAVAVDPWAPPRLVALGSFLFDLGDLAGAEQAFARAIELAPDFPEPSYLLAKIHQIRGQDELAEARMAALRAVASDHPATHTLVGRFEAERGRFDAAEAYLGRGPTELGFTRMVRAQVALQRGDGEQAARLMDGVGDRLAAGPPRARLHILALRGDLDGVLETLAGHWRQGLRGEVTDPPDVGIYFIDHADFLAEMRHDPRFQSRLAEIRAPLDSLRTLVPALPF